MANPTISQLQDMVQRSEPRARDTRVVLIDGPAGAGKTTLANALAVALGGSASAGPGTYGPDHPLVDDVPVQVLHSDDMYEGWDGLDTLEATLVDSVLAPLADAGAGSFLMWDWHQGRRTHEIPVSARPFVVVEGVGVNHVRARPYASLTVYVDAPAKLRLARGLERDGEAMREEWLRWQSHEMSVLAHHRAKESADVVVDGTVPVA